MGIEILDQVLTLFSIMLLKPQRHRISSNIVMSVELINETWKPVRVHPCSLFTLDMKLGFKTFKIQG